MVWVKRAALALLVFVVIGAAGFLLWAYTPLGPAPEALVALQSTGQVKVETSRWIVFSPTAGQPDTGFIIYPGGRVDPRSYAPPAHALAGQGYLVVIVPMPLNLAVFGSNRAAGVMAAYPAIRHWAVGGHSLGGAMAAQFVHAHPDWPGGLALWAAYPPGGANLSSRPLVVVSTWGSQDGVINRQSLAASHGLLPPATTWLEIAGGNHAQFGSYGPQPGDNPAGISGPDQQAQAVTATAGVLAALQRTP